MESIKLKAKLSAYTKGVLPQLPDDYIKDVINLEKNYNR